MFTYDQRYEVDGPNLPQHLATGQKDSLVPRAQAIEKGRVRDEVPHEAVLSTPLASEDFRREVATVV